MGRRGKEEDREEKERNWEGCGKKKKRREEGEREKKWGERRRAKKGI